MLIIICEFEFANGTCPQNNPIAMPNTGGGVVKPAHAGKVAQAGVAMTMMAMDLDGDGSLLVLL